MKVKRVVVESLEEFFSEVKDLVHKGKGKIEFISVGSIEELNRILTPQRKRLLDVVRRHKPSSIRELAEKLGRDYRNVYDDVVFLEKMGFLNLRRRGKKLVPEVDYDAIDIQVRIGAPLTE